MELFFLLLLIVIMAGALGSGYPVAFALPGAAIITIALAAGAGWIFAGHTDAYFHSGGSAAMALGAGVTNLRGVYWEVERDTLIAIPLFIFMGIMLQRSKIAEDLLGDHGAALRARCRAVSESRWSSSARCWRPPPASSGPPSSPWA